MGRTEDLFNAVQKTLGDRPVYLLAGASDLVNEKLRELPETVSAWQKQYGDMPVRIAGTLIGQAFRANLKAGQLYDDLNRRGQDVVARMRGEHVVAEEDEPFVREPFMPEPVRPLTTHAAFAESELAATSDGKPRATAAKKAAAKKADRSAAKKAAAKKTAAKKTAAKKAGTKAAPKGRQGPAAK